MILVFLQQFLNIQKTTILNNISKQLFQPILMIEESSQIANNSSQDVSNEQLKCTDKRKIQNNKKQSQLKSNSNINKLSSNQSSCSNSSSKPPCINKICPKLKNSNIKSHQNKTYAFDPEDLCAQCLIQYKKQSFCLYCKQIYFDSSDDGKEWILCEDCGRWVHSQCANYDPTFDSDFKCIKCKKNDHLQNSQNILTKKQSGKINPKNVQKRKQLVQCSLNTYGFYWQLGAKQLAQDMDKIRQFLQ